MIKISTGIALGILCGVTLHAASSFTEDLPLTPVPAHLLGPTEVKYDLGVHPAGSAPILPRYVPRGDTDYRPEDFLGKVVILVQPPTPTPAAFLERFEDPIFPFESHLLDGIGVPSNPQGNLSGLAGLAILGFGVMIIYRGIQRAQGVEES